MAVKIIQKINFQAQDESKTPVPVSREIILVRSGNQIIFRPLLAKLIAGVGIKLLSRSFHTTAGRL
jgi:hypothetical protein